MTARQEEQHLVQRLLARDRNAWRLFVEGFQGLVYARVSRTVLEYNRALDRVDIEDICADVFAQLVANDFASLRRFEGRSSLATWLSVVARRVCLRHLQKRRIDVATRSSTNAEEVQQLLIHESDALTKLIQAEDAGRLHEMLSHLSPSDQHVLRLFYIEQLGYVEISRRLKISVNTVGPKLHRAQKRLRRLLERRHYQSRRNGSP